MPHPVMVSAVLSASRRKATAEVEGRSRTMRGDSKSPNALRLQSSLTPFGSAPLRSYHAPPCAQGDVLQLHPYKNLNN
jgi:hypothetical protein